MSFTAYFKSSFRGTRQPSLGTHTPRSPYANFAGIVHVTSAPGCMYSTTDSNPGITCCFPILNVIGFLPFPSVESNMVPLLRKAVYLMTTKSPGFGKLPTPCFKTMYLIPKSVCLGRLAQFTVKASEKQ